MRKDALPAGQATNPDGTTEPTHCSPFPREEKHQDLTILVPDVGLMCL